ncbi:hypothetical protein FISHEDRAFT_74085 [Fistulina hepatica ATCC 64428]|uniref:Uncharacterized protein n=1 Tax=Fistulina hepatica ATCC 64428 TaxID=1128425 RepID=A0A0D7AC63_9AGAR|nr:hypothetical protein FISHEDRAFT_74085 [Fistulina hepatica ATCC 64428]
MSDNVMQADADQSYIFGPLISADASSNELADGGSFGPGSPVYVLCADLKRQYEEIDKAIDTFVHLVHSCSSSMSYEFLNLRPQTYPVVLHLTQVIAEFLLHVITTVDTIHQAVMTLGYPFSFGPLSADGTPLTETEFDKVFAFFERIAPEQRATREMLPRVHDTLKDTQQRLLEIIAIPNTAYFTLFKLLPLFTPPYVERRKETLGHIPVLLPSIGVSVNQMADTLDQLCDLFYSVAKSVSVQRIKEEERSKRYGVDVCALTTRLRAARFNIRRGQHIYLHACITNDIQFSW